MNQKYDESQEARRQLKIDCEQLSTKIVELEEELYESKSIQLDLLEQLKQMEHKFEMISQEFESHLELSEQKIQQLLNINEQLENGQAIYIAKKNDKVDRTLGQFLNMYPERQKLQIMFLRESEGVYQFGQKRVYIKIEKGNQILCRVGGGYMNIDDFITQYT